MIYYLDLFGVGFFAVAGALAAGRKQMDLFGVVVLALVTALGGGTLRDVTLGAYPLFWVADPMYVLVAASASVATFFAARFWDLPGRAMPLADALGLAFFTILGTKKALGLGVHPGIAAMMGLMTGVAGGIVRDVLCGEIPLVLRREIYATASLAGAAVFVIAGHFLPGGLGVVTVVAMAVTLAVRLAAIRWNLSLPRFAPRGRRKSSS